MRYTSRLLQELGLKQGNIEQYASGLVKTVGYDTVDGKIRTPSCNNFWARDVTGITLNVIFGFVSLA